MQQFDIRLQQKNLNTYDPVLFKQEFSKTDIFATMSQDFDLVHFDWHFSATDDLAGTVRQWYGGKDRKTIFSAVSFYYLQYLTANYQGDIYDIGCGWNIFKKYLPNIIGVDKFYNCKTWKPDIDMWFDESFCQKFHNQLDRIMSINSLHFIPFDQLRKRVIDFFSLLAPNGIGYLSLNLMRMIETDPTLRNKSREEFETIVRTELFDIGYEYLVFDIDFTLFDCFLDGNIRMVVQNNRVAG